MDNIILFFRACTGFTLVWFLFVSAVAYVQDRAFAQHIKHSLPYGTIAAIAYFLLKFIWS